MITRAAMIPNRIFVFLFINFTFLIHIFRKLTVSVPFSKAMHISPMYFNRQHTFDKVLSCSKGSFNKRFHKKRPNFIGKSDA